jgi:inosine-uridine nucleoside N-ribohydrolase
MRRVVPWLLGVFLLAAGAVAAVVVLGGRDGDEGPTPVIVDYSPTLSDVPALLYVAARPDVDLLAVTLPGTGESSCAAGVRHTRQLLASVGLGDVPVGCGREEPLAGDRDWPAGWRQSADTLPGLELSEVPDVPVPDAVELLVDTLAAADDPVTVLTLSSLTNLGLLVRDHPDTVEGIERIVIMGGAFGVPGNVEDEPTAEWNLYIDPEADRLVLGSGTALTLIPLDATNDVPGNRRLIARARQAQGHPAGKAAVQLWNANADFVASEGFYFWDELTAAATFEPELVTLEERTVVVDDLGAIFEDPAGTPVRIATGADRDGFEQNLLDVLNGAPVPPPAPLSETELEYARALQEGLDVLAKAEEETFRTSPEPGEDARAAALEGVDSLWRALKAFRETLASQDPPSAFREAHEEMRSAVGGLIALESAAVAALKTPEAAAAENPLVLVQEAVGDPLGELATRLFLACGRIADDLLLRDGPELTCSP